MDHIIWSILYIYYMVTLSISYGPYDNIGIRIIKELQKMRTKKQDSSDMLLSIFAGLCLLSIAYSLLSKNVFFEAGSKKQTTSNIQNITLNILLSNEEFA